MSTVRPGGRELSRGMMLLCLAAGAITFYLMFAYRGPFQWIAEAQLKWMGAYSEKLTFLLTYLLVMGVLAGLAWVVRKVGLPSEPGGEKRAGASLSEWIIFVLIGAGFAVVGCVDYWRAAHAGVLTSVDVRDLEEGKEPTSLWVRARGIAITKAEVQFGKGARDQDRYVPVVSGENDPREKGVHLFIKAKASAEVSGEEFEGFLSRRDLPGPVRVEMEREGVIKDDYYVLDLGLTPAKKMGNARIMIWIGAGIAGLGVMLMGWRRMKRAKIAEGASAL